MKEVLRKAKLQGQKSSAFIAINHLSPNRNLRHFKENEDLKVRETQEKFGQFEN